MTNELLLKDLPKEFSMFKVSAFFDESGISLRVVNVGLAKVTDKKINYDSKRINHNQYLVPNENTYDLSSDIGWRRTSCCSAEVHLEKAKKIVVEKIMSNQKDNIIKLERQLVKIKLYTNFDVCSLKEYMEE